MNETNVDHFKDPLPHRLLLNSFLANPSNKYFPLHLILFRPHSITQDNVPVFVTG